MNKDNAAQYLPFVQALAEGKTIQVKTGDGRWVTRLEYSFSDDPEYYRIKSEPVKRYVATWFSESGCLQISVFAPARQHLEYASGRQGFKIHELDCGEAP